MKVAVLGAGAWGTALARLLCLNGHSVVLWGHDADRLAAIARTHTNARYLPGIHLPDTLRYEPDILAAVRDSECTIVAVPSKAFRSVTKQLATFTGIAATVTKGIEYETGLTMCGVLRTTMPMASAVALSGPTMALEVARDVPLLVENPREKHGD